MVWGPRSPRWEAVTEAQGQGPTVKMSGVGTKIWGVYWDLGAGQLGAGAWLGGACCHPHLEGEKQGNNAEVWEGTNGRPS